MKKEIFVLLFILINNISNFAQEPTYYYILESKTSAINTADYSVSPPIYTKLPEMKEPVQMNSNGTYNGLALTKDLYGNFIFQLITFLPSGKIVTSSNFLGDGSTQVTNNELLASYKINVTSEYCFLETNVILMSQVKKDMENKVGLSIMGVIFNETYRIQK